MSSVKEAGGRKTQIIEISERLFKEKGYLATSMRDIADGLGIEPASLYSHISSKDEVLWEIASRCAKDFHSAINPIYDSGLHTQQKLTEMIARHVEVICSNLDASAVFFHEWRHLEEPRRSEYAETRDNYEQKFKDVVMDGIRENLFLNYDEGFTTRAILSALNWTHTWYRKDGELRPNQIGERLAALLLNGLIRNI